MTYTQLINKVLTKLRESLIASPNDSAYALLIGDFINETKREVEAAWKWNALNQTIPITTVDGTATYAITGSGDRFKLQSPNLSVYSVTEKNFLFKQDSAWMKSQAIENTAKMPPMYYFFEGLDSNGDTYVTLHNTPGAVYTINFNLNIPQADFSTGSETLSVPYWPVVLGAYAKAIAERGEDSGKTSGEAEARYQNALADSIAIDNSKMDGMDEWTVA
jgi:hypothetical protein